MSRSLLIRGGMVASGRGVTRLDVRIVDGAIVEVGKDLTVSVERVIEADGLHVLPGIIDAHSHMWEPGLASRPDFRDDTASAAAGGITTIIDHPLTPPEIVTRPRFEDKVRLGERSSYVDFALHGGLDPDHLDDVAELWKAGATAFKMFTCETGCPMRGFLDEADQRAALRAVASLGGVVLVHAEDQAILDANRAQLLSSGDHRAEAFPRWRSLEAELSAVASILRLAKEEAASPYFVHCSAPDVVDLIAEAQRTGLRTWAETCPHYLSLTTEDIAKRGHRATTSPPVRDTDRMLALRTRLGTAVAVVGSDNGAVLAERKDIDDAFGGQPGLPGNETMLPLMLELVALGETSLDTVAAVLSENPARIFGLTRKGRIDPGCDGDVTIVDLSTTTEVAAAGLHGPAGWSPYEGWRLRGRVVMTAIRGAVSVDGGDLRVEPGFGRFVPRDDGR